MIYVYVYDIYLYIYIYVCVCIFIICIYNRCVCFLVWRGTVRKTISGVRCRRSGRDWGGECVS